MTDGGEAMAMADEHCERIGSHLILTDPPSGRRARGDIRGRDGGVLAQWNRRRHCGRSLYIYVCVCVCECLYIRSIDGEGWSLLRISASFQIANKLTRDGRC